MLTYVAVGATVALPALTRVFLGAGASVLAVRLAGARQVLALLAPVLGRTRALVRLETLAPPTAAALTAHCNVTSLKQI